MTGVIRKPEIATTRWKEFRLWDSSSSVTDGRNSKPTGETALPQWVGSIQDDFSLQGRGGSGNYSVAFYHPWGAPGVSAAVAILYSAWVTGANALLVAVMLTCPRLLNSRQNILVLHVAIVDLTVGLFYCPLTADFYIRGQWTHGCDSFFVWFIFLYPQVFLSVHLMGLLNGARLAGTLCSARAGRWVKNVLFAGALMMLWFYLIMIGASLDASRRDNFRIAISRDHLCRALVASDGAIATNIMVFFAPACLTLLLWVLNLLREKTSTPIPRSQLQLDCETEQTLKAPLFVLSAATFTTCLLPFPAFLITTTLAAGGCASAPCLHWVVPLSTVAEWVLFAKAGVNPLLWLLLSPDFKGVLLGAFHHFRRVPTSDTRDLVESEAQGGAENDDTPFSEM
ncbi:hypothetical protein ACOMHN_027962 [Nucella lapillus]